MSVVTVAVLDAFHVVKLGTAALDEIRRRVQQETLGHRGRKGDPLYGIQNVLRCGAERLTDKQQAPPGQGHRRRRAGRRGPRRLAVRPAAARGLQGRQRRRRQEDCREGLGVVPDPPDPGDQAARQDLKRWREAFLAYVDTPRASNGGAEAINGLIELHRRVARGFRNRNNYRLRMLLIGGGLNHPHPKVRRARLLR